MIKIVNSTALCCEPNAAKRQDPSARSNVTRTAYDITSMLPKWTNSQKLIQGHSNEKELGKLAQTLPKPTPQPQVPRMITIQCRHKTCRYVLVTTERPTKCPNCGVSMKVDRDRYNVNHALKQGYGSTNLSRAVYSA